MKLREIHIKGYKSIDGDVGQSIRFGDVTVLLGANGSGKSNLVSLFTMLNSMRNDILNHYVGKYGVNSLLFYGPKKTKSISFDMQFESDEGNIIYSIELSHGLINLFVKNEKIKIHKKNGSQQKVFFLTDNEDKPVRKKAAGNYSRSVYNFLSGIRTYQFHDTSDTAKIKDRAYVDDAKYLRHDGGNLAAFLKMLQGHAPYVKYYDRIIRHIQRVMPQFADFDLESIPGAENYVRLNWKDSSGSDYLLDPHQISDGSLRFMALATLLLQPPALLPKFIVLDEPELGLHPDAIEELGGFVRIAAQNTQVLLATQSTRLVDEFSPEELVIVERDEQNHCSIFKKLDTEQLEDWLERYCLSELWEKNVLGGQP